MLHFVYLSLLAISQFMSFYFYLITARDFTVHLLLRSLGGKAFGVLLFHFGLWFLRRSWCSLWDAVFSAFRHLLQAWVVMECICVWGWASGGHLGHWFCRLYGWLSWSTFFRAAQIAFHGDFYGPGVAACIISRYCLLMLSFAKLETSVPIYIDKLELKVYGFDDKLPVHTFGCG